ncbi:MAG TPA: GTP-binding protein, partial [Candidatus Methanomethylia archaeon]|nr:GTP-binding protein [Candidatus Methanomethylicia archaeon]
MPTNLPPEAKVLERRYREARTLQEKIRALEAYISAIPEHKGTEKLLRHLKRRLADLRRELEEQKKRRVGGGVGFAIKKEGAAQVVILGMPNSGKSTLLAALTAAKPEIADYPCTTTMPVPGMMPYEDIQIQLVEAPALMEGASEGVAWGLQVLSLARNADGLIILLD